MQRRQIVGGLGVAIVCLLLAACGRRVRLVPVAGRVTLDGKPLQKGGLMVQPRSGPAAQARINADGTFRLGTFGAEDGVIPGPAAVRVFCREELPSSGGERVFGPSLIPERYTRFDTSGITVDIAIGMEPLDIALSSK